MFWIILMLLLPALAMLLARVHLSLFAWGGVLAVAILILISAGMPVWPGVLLLLLDVAGVAVFHMYAWRIRLISRPLFRYIRQAIPPISETERTALEAGSIWWEAELMRGEPDWQKLRCVAEPSLTKKEQAFIDGPVEQLCGMLNDWEIHHRLRDLPEPVWKFLKEHRFFGMIIPESYGGLAFSAYAHSRVLQKIASRSSAAAVTVMVPNSLGPAELLLAYGTEAQKDYYLPRLARGEEIPCFALTTPEAGSDAGGMTDYGIVCEQEFDGKPTLGLRLNWSKRYITLGPVATVLGLAFKVYDPDHLLGEQDALGITCALIPVNTPGVVIGRRHDPLNIAFMNGPNEGHDVFIPLDWVIGGQKMIGQGWRMLIERLSVGRGISLPSLSVASGKLAAESCGLYTRVRKQFHTPIGRFEGVQEALARIGGMTYLMDATARLTTSALDAGERPAIVTAMAKRYLTEGMRQVINDAMDVHGGRGVCMGPANYLGRTYQSIPVAITVEGANILTRSFMIFGQGSVRCHPYLLSEMEAVALPEAEGLPVFDELLMQHLAYTLANIGRSFAYSISLGWLAPAPVSGRAARYYRQIARCSAGLGAMADMTLLVLGGALKRKEFLSGRFADVLAHLYMCSAVLKRYEDEGQVEADWPLVRWSCNYCLYQVQQAMDGILHNFPVRPVAWLMRLWVLPWGRWMRPPSDCLTRKVAEILLEDSPTHDRLVNGIYPGEGENDIIGRLRIARDLVVQAEPVEMMLREKGERWQGPESYDAWLARLVADGVLEESQQRLLLAAREAMLKAIAVDDFPADEWQREVNRK